MTEIPSSDAGSCEGERFVVLPDTAKLEALAEFAAGAGHEINNPLATIIGRAQMLLKDEHDPQRRQMLLSIGAQAYRIRDMIGDAMLFGRPPRPELQSVNLAEVAGRVVTKHAAELESNRVTIRMEIPDSVFVRADSTQIAIVLGELLCNSGQALQPQGGEICLTASFSAGRPEVVVIEVIDHGKGFTQTEQEHAFDPFFSGRQAGRGLGFGLPKCWRIVEQHGGRIEILASAVGPTTVRIHWPVDS